MQDFPGGPEVKNLPCNAGMWVRFLVWELRSHMPQSSKAHTHLLSPCALKPVCHNYWSPYTTTRGPACHSWARVPQLESPHTTTKVLPAVTKTLLLLLLSHFSRVQLCATPDMAAHQVPPSLGLSRQEHWSGLPFPSPIHEREKWKWSRSVVSDSSRPHGLWPTRLLCPWDFPGKSTGVGCHCVFHK